MYFYKFNNEEELIKELLIISFALILSYNNLFGQSNFNNIVKIVCTTNVNGETEPCG